MQIVKNTRGRKQACKSVVQSSLFLSSCVHLCVWNLQRSCLSSLDPAMREIYSSLRGQVACNSNLHVHSVFVLTSSLLLSACALAPDALSQAESETGADDLSLVRDVLPWQDEIRGERCE